MSQIAMVLIWWLALTAFGLAVLPLTIRVFKHLPHAAWAFARPLGLLLVGYLFWQGATSASCLTTPRPSLASSSWSP